VKLGVALKAVSCGVTEIYLSGLRFFSSTY
jgi:hypothetical protein